MKLLRFRPLAGRTYYSDATIVDLHVIVEPDTSTKETYIEKPGNSFGRFEKAVKQILAVPKKETDKREAEYQRTTKTQG